MRSRAVLGYSLLFFLSGATGLVYELLWVRLLYQAFGATIQSVTTVVAAYMGGLGLGAWWFGRRADRHPRPAALYGWLELAIGAFAALSPLALTLVRQVYVALATGLHAGAPVSVALRFGLAALVLLVPTTLMGGTLPVLTRAFAGSDRAALQPTLGRLYGLNTLGAVLGTALAGFVLIEHVGIRASLWGTALVNFAGPGGTIQTLSYAKVLNGEVKAEMIKDKAVFVGTTSPSLHDRFPTPYGIMPGVELLANAFRTFEDQDFVHKVPSGVHYVILLVLGMVTSSSMGGLIHVLLVIAIVMVLLNLISGRRRA